MPLNLKLKTGSRPIDLWVERLSIFSEPRPENLIREVTLRRGVNVIWAKEPVSDSLSDASSVVGHGVGKTSFCLLLRYCLGDDGTLVKKLLDELKAPFKYGGVGAVIYLGGKPYSVFRYFGDDKDVYAKTDSINSLLLSEETGPYSEFEGLLEQRMCSNLTAKKIPETGQKIEWSHILAWLTRDQGARFASFFKWRSGEGIGLSRPALDPPIVMRAVLRLLEAKEQDLLGAIQRDKKAITQDQYRLDQQIKEADLVRKRIESDLRQWLNASDKITLETTDLFQPGIFQLLEENNTPYNQKLRVQEKALQDLEDNLQPLRVRHQIAKQTMQYWSKEVELTKARRKGDENEIRRLQEERSKLVNLAGHCGYANIPYANCTHIQEKLSTSSLQDQREAGSLKKNIGQWAESETKALGNSKRANQELLTVQKELAAGNDELRRLKIKRDTALVEAKRGEYIKKELERWQNAFGSDKSNQAANKITEQIKVREADLQTKETKLTVIRNAINERASELSKITNYVAKYLLNSISGKFEPFASQYPFQLLVGSGEAHNVMNVLMGDLVCLLHATRDVSGFPAFLVHDCPREADMSEQLYQRYLQLFYELDSSSSGSEPTFQYIVTTTSCPPVVLQKNPYCRLVLSSETVEQLLLKRHLLLQQEQLSV